MIQKAVTVYLAYRAFDQGLSNLLGLETLRHGASLTSRVSLLFNGIDPQNFGCSASGSSAAVGLRDPSGKKFYVFKDSKFLEGSKPSYIFLRKRIQPLLHKFLTAHQKAQNLILGEALSKQAFFSAPRQKLGAMCLSIPWGLISFAVPTVKLRFSDKQIKEYKFENDPLYGGMAYMTAEKINSLKHWEIVGTLCQGLNSDVFARIQKHPDKFLTGICQIAVACGVIQVLGGPQSALNFTSKHPILAFAAASIF